MDFTTERYSRAFEKFRVWAASYKEISVLPTNVLHVATYLEFLLQSNSSYSALEAAVGRMISLDYPILTSPTLRKVSLNQPKDAFLDR